VPFSLTDNPTAAGVLLVFGPRGSTRFVRGDANGDGTVNISDAVAILGYLFLGAAVPPCLDAGDTDDSGSLDLSDAVSVLNHLFLGAAPPPSPYPERGLDPTADEMRCF
jgi:hypothetical protein